MVRAWNDPPERAGGSLLVLGRGSGRQRPAGIRSARHVPSRHLDDKPDDEADPQNPPANVADAPTELPNSLTVVVPGQAHTVGHLGCMPSIVESFVAAGTVDGLDVSCAATSVPLPPFRTSP